MSEGVWDDALLAARLCAYDPGLGGIVLRAGGDLRDTVIAALRGGLAGNAPVRRLPPQIGDDALLGGLDLGATLALGRPVRQAGVLAAADGGVLVVPMAERLGEGTAARIAGVLDTGMVEGERARFAVVALDDGVEDEVVPAALAERLAFRFDLSALRHPGPLDEARDRLEPRPIVQTADGALVEGWAPAQGRGDGGGASDAVLDAIAVTALALGIDSARASLFALRAAWAAAALDGRREIEEADVILAVRLVLAPRATRVPAPPEAEDAAAEPPPPESDSGPDEQGEQQPMSDVVLEAVLASLPPDVLARLAAGPGRRGTSRSNGSGERRKSPQRGRSLGAHAGLPRGGLRLSLIDTLRAAAPWQKVRARGDGPVRIRRDDLRIRRFETRSESVTIFAVDASGSAAAARLAEAKGAVELLLAQAYVARAQVALIAFRGTGAELLLPPTRSLTRARRALAELPGGGGTPLAAGLDAALLLAQAARGKGRTPFLVVLTDGRANIAADGTAVRERAEREAEDAARAIGQAGIGAAFIDTSARPRPEGARLALAMGARYLPLPRADAAAMQKAISAAQAA